MEGLAPKKAQLENVGVSENDSAMQSNKIVMDWSTVYDILRIIFSYLNARDLAKVSMVCRSWLKAANDEKSTRGPCCMSQFYKSVGHLDHIIKSYDLLCEIQNMKIKPSVGFVFASFLNKPNNNIEERIQALLHCDTVMIANDFQYLGTTSLISYALLPQIPNVRIKFFIIEDESKYHEIITTINNQEKICFMVYGGNLDTLEKASQLIAYIRESPEINKIESIFGGLTGFLYTKYYNDNSYYTLKEEGVFLLNCVVILITGPIQSWSMILYKEKYNTEEKIEIKLKLFKDQVILKKNSIGFMTTNCVPTITDQNNLEKDICVESRIFRRLFPKVPLAVFYNDLLFGKDTVVDQNREGNSENVIEPYEISSFATVFLIITYD